MATPQLTKQKWYENKMLLIALFFLFPPLGIYGIWKRKGTKDWKKAVYTILATFPILLLFLIIISNLSGDNSSYTTTSIEKQKSDEEFYKKVEEERKIGESQKKIEESQLRKLADFQKKWADSILESESKPGNRHFVAHQINSPFTITFEYTESITKNGFNENVRVDTIAYKEFYEDALRRKFGTDFVSPKTQINFTPNSKVDFQKVTADNNRNRDRNNKIMMQFSQWDGSHSNLKKMVKSSMNDPSSFEHVKTTYSDKGSYILVQMSFRGSNAFGATVLNSISAKVDENGNILSISNN